MNNEIPSWLIEEDAYIPLKDKDSFINKSIKAFLKLLSNIRSQGYIKPSKYRVNAILKTLFTFILLILISVTRSFGFLMVVIIYLLAALSMLPGYKIIKTLKISLFATIFTLFIMFPATLINGSYSTVLMTIKVFAAVSAVNILSQSTRWTSITGSLKGFYIPDIFILVLDITIKYLVLLGDFSLNMLYALKLRSVGKNNNKYSSLSGIAGTMFIKSKEMSEEMYHAMECRGFSGEYHKESHLKFTFFDLFYVLINIGIILIFLYFGRV